MRQGDILGLEVLVRAHQVRAVRAAYLITHDRALAEDIVQSAFIRAFERISQFDTSRSFGPWFLKSVVNDAVKAVEHRRRLLPLSIGAEAGDDAEDGNAVQFLDPSPDPEAALLLAESRDEVWSALDRLPVEQCRAVVLRYYLGLSEAEVANQLGVPPGTAKSRLHNARKRLHGMLGTLHPRRAPRGSEPSAALIKPNGTHQTSNGAVQPPPGGTGKP
jgi:RNA polymerase sigma-70 factor (ECF subfamily)